jgi:hypothetical protein
MAMHMLPGFPLDWAEGCVNVHLIRHPARVIASYTEKRESPPRRHRLPPAGRALRPLPRPCPRQRRHPRQPAGNAEKLCAEIGLDFRPGMLSWPAGPKPFDGIWAPHWYDAVHRSTGFAGPRVLCPRSTGPRPTSPCRRCPITRKWRRPGWPIPSSGGKYSGGVPAIGRDGGSAPYFATRRFRVAISLSLSAFSRMNPAASFWS